MEYIAIIVPSLIAIYATMFAIAKTDLDFYVYNMKYLNRLMISLLILIIIYYIAVLVIIFDIQRSYPSIDMQPYRHKYIGWVSWGTAILGVTQFISAFIAVLLSKLEKYKEEKEKQTPISS